MIKNKRKQDRVPRKVKKARSGKYKFSVRTHPIKGIVSFIMGISSLLAFLILCVQSGNAKGTSGVIAGAVGMLAMIISIVGFILAMVTIRKKDIHYRFPVAGGIINGLLMVVYFILYIWGIL